MDDAQKLRELQKLYEESKRQIQQEKERADKLAERADKLEEAARKTTLDEYLVANHQSMFCHLAVETNKHLTTKGSINIPRSKLCPAQLREWLDFTDQQRRTLGRLLAAYPKDERLFQSRTACTTLGESLSGRKISSEKGLELFLHVVVENPLRLILDKLKAVEKVGQEFGIGDGVSFENHHHTLREDADEILEAMKTPKTPDQGRCNRHIQPDQFCVYVSKPPEERTVLYISEYKAPHKLTADHFRVGLHPMDVYKDIIHRNTIPSQADTDARFQYHSERLTAAAITQTYHYMIEDGLEYGLLTTGEVFVFLNIDWQHPATLYYHITEPIREVAVHKDDAKYCTAVAQCLVFILTALGAPGERRIHLQNERDSVMKDLNRWTECFEDMLLSIPETERSAPPGSVYAPRDNQGIGRSPYLLRPRKRRPRAESDCRDDRSMLREQIESSDDESDPQMPESPSQNKPYSRGQGRATQRSERNTAQQPQAGSGQTRAYCTQRCLLGLVRGTPLDEQCPNAALHQQGAPEGRHPVSHAEFLRLLHGQLERSLDDGLTKLGLGGSRGVLFQVTLLAHGYTFVSKGTVEAFIPDLQHEQEVYELLKKQQGIAVPVFLGAVDLRSIGRVYYYEHRVYIKYMMFLSWAGKKIDGSASRHELLECLRSIHEEGVVHGDVRWPNVLSDPQTGRVMVVDFERASIVKPARRPLRQVMPNKRAWDHERGEEKSSSRAHGHDAHTVGFEDDIRGAKGVCSG